jgi:fucose 4-O-acetylase-like acetyltransferase
MENNYKRLLYIDNLRIILVVLVVLAHVAITYGPVGFWYYYERTELNSTYVLAFFVSLMQAFLIGLFFMISAFFTPSALNKKGPKNFFIDRIKRLGIPLIFYIFIIAPSILYLDNLIIKGERVNYFIFYYERVLKRGIIDVGPLWFLQVLLFFSILYAICNEIILRILKDKRQLVLKFPSNKNIFITILILAIVTFLVRLKFPISATTSHLNFGLAPQYIFLFGLGILAFNNNWFEAITVKKAKFWFRITIFTILFWPVFIFFGRSPGLSIEIFAGGLNWQSFIYAFWEAVLSISLSICIIYLFKKKFNHQTKLFKEISKSAYSVFIIHSIVIVLLSYSLKDLMFHPLVKFAIVALVGIPLCFLISFYITRVRFLKKIL